MTRRHLRLLGALVLFGGAAAAAGCGNKTDSHCPPPTTLDVRNGEWEIMEEIRFSGDDTLCFPDSGLANADTVIIESYIDTLVQCELNPWGDPNSPDLCCETTVDGNNIDVSCRATYPLDVDCDYLFETTATGTVTDTTWDLTLKFLDTIAGPSNPCVFFDGYQDTCLTEIHSVGRWLSAEGDTCGSAAIAGEDVLRRVLARARTRTRATR